MRPKTADRLQAVRREFEKLIDLVTGSSAHQATLNQMERHLFRGVLRLGYQLLQLFLAQRVAAESHVPVTRPTGQTLAYHSQQETSYFSVFGKLVFRRAYFYAAAAGSVCLLDAALSLPARCYCISCCNLPRCWRSMVSLRPVPKFCRICWR